MNYSIITIKSDEVPDIPHLNPLDMEQLLQEIISQLHSDKYKLVDEKLGSIEPIKGYKTPLTNSEIILHVCLREHDHDFTDSGSINKNIYELIANKNLKIVDAVRHPYEKHMRIIANLDSET